MNDREPRDPGMFLPPLDEEPGPAPELDRAHAQRLASAVVRKWSAASVASASAGLVGLEPPDDLAGPAMPLSKQQVARAARLVSWRHRLTRLPWRSAAALVLSFALGGVAFAAFQAWRGPAAPSASVGTGRQALSVPARFQHEMVVAPPTAAEVAIPSVASPLAQGTRVAAVAADDTTSAPAQPPPKSASAAELLQRANAARTKRAWSLAERTYLRVLALPAQTHERYAAAVAAAQLALEHSRDARRALSLYQQALGMAPDGDLAEEARYGVAQAYRALGQADAERTALQSFIAHHPQSLRAPEAEARLRALQ